MTEKFDSKFHKWYVGGDGEVVERPLPSPTFEVVGMTYEEVLDEYRIYMGDPLAEFPQAIIDQLKMAGKVPEENG